MTFSTVFEYTQKINLLLRVEYFYMGDKIEDPKAFFEANPTIFEFFFPSPDEILSMISTNLKFKETHRLVISEYGFHLVHL